MRQKAIQIYVSNKKHVSILNDLLNFGCTVQFMTSESVATAGTYSIHGLTLVILNLPENEDLLKQINEILLTLKN